MLPLSGTTAPGAEAQKAMSAASVRARHEWVTPAYSNARVSCSTAPDLVCQDWFELGLRGNQVKHKTRHVCVFFIELGWCLPDAS